MGEDYINSVEAKGWIKGYNDGTFKPNNNITRGEYVTLMNNLLERKVKIENTLPGIKEFNDLNTNKWHYEQMIEALNGHEYKRLEDNTGKWIN